MPTNVPVSTTLSAALGAADTTLTVASVTGFPASGAVQIDNEILNYAAISGSSFTGLQRAQRTSTAAAHNSGATVQQVIVFSMSSDEARVMSGVERDLETVFAGSAQGTTTGGTQVQVGALPKYFMVASTDRPSVRDSFRAAALALQHNLAPAVTELAAGTTGADKLLSPWANATGFNTAAYFKDGLGQVRMKGVVSGGAINSTIFQLSAGNRPAATTVLATTGISGSTFSFACVQVGTDGSVKLVAGAGSIALDGLTFLATQ